MALFFFWLFLVPLLECVTYKNLVYHLSTTEVEDFISTNNKTIILYTIPDDLYSQASIVEFERASYFLKHEYHDTSVKFGIYESEEKTYVHDQQKIIETPTVQYCHKDAILTLLIQKNLTNKTNNINCELFSKDIAEFTIANYIQNLNKKCSKQVTNITQFISENDIAGIAYLNDKLHFEFYDSLCKKYELDEPRSFTPVFGYINEFNQSLVIYNKQKGTRSVYNGDMLNENELIKFIEIERFPWIAEMNGVNFGEYTRTNAPIVWIGIEDKNSEYVNMVERFFVERFAKKMKGKCLFVWISSVRFIGHIRKLGIPWIPGVLITDEDEKYLYDPEADLFDTVKLEEFFQGWMSNNLDEYHKCEHEDDLKKRIEKEKDDTKKESLDVLHLDSSQLNILLTHKEFEKQNIFVLYYAPWDTRCMALVKPLENVGLYFKKKEVRDSNVIIAKINCEENDVVNENIIRYPTMKLYKNDSFPKRDGVLYKGRRNSRDIIQFIEIELGIREVVVEIDDEGVVNDEEPNEPFEYV